MKTYLVGGAVRDQLLGLAVREKDWVVVGARPETLLQQGFLQVGRDFPVFLHPETREEYALARTEKKTGTGYLGFVCHATPEVTLEEDLARRDLTINAMAIDDQGHLIDPFLGAQDLQQKILRHVSAAFVEDPVRVLRVARFLARFQHLGFKIAPETLQLMRKMVRQGELAHLVAERVWQEWQRSLNEKNPEAFIHALRACGALKVVLPELDRLFGVPNSVKHHGEVDTGIHSLMALKSACHLTEDPIVRFAALLHDLGKGCTPMAIWPKQHQHDKLGVPVIKTLCQRLAVPKNYQKLAVLGSDWHLLIARLPELTAKKIVEVLEKIQAFRNPEVLEQLLLVCEADFRGRGVGANSYQNNPYPRAAEWRIILAACMEIDAKKWVAEGLSGIAIKEALHAERIACVQKLQENRV